MDSSSAQAWLFAMTSGLASAIGGATLYLDPLLHALGVSRGFNVLDSHTVLSALLASASGAMAYTSISVLTSESIEHLENVAALAKYKGVVAAALFVVGALFNLLLGRVVTLIMPRDSPIKHACGSHPPSPGESQDEEAHADGHDGSSRTVDAEGSGCSSRGSTQSAHAHAEHQPLLLRSDAAGCRCEYACTRPGCYMLEHCHITPLYPHVHMHGQGSSHA
ncbi:hypothetical protein IWW55_001132, partial [Coemansia sp. RSA 2706]